MLGPKGPNLYKNKIMKQLSKKIKENLFKWYLYTVLVWVHVALAFQIAMMVLSVTNPELERRIGNELTWALDGTFNK